MKVCVLGSNGQLGSDIVDLLQYDGITGSDIRESRCSVKEFWPSHLKDYDIIINTVAKHKPLEKCEKYIHAVTDLNVNFVFELADWCWRRSKIFIHISTDHCQDPKSMYALSKLWGESVISHFMRTRGLKAYILRAAALHGPKGTNFIETIMSKANLKENVWLPEDQLTSFSHTKDVALAIASLIAAEAEFGIYNCAGIYEGMSFYDIARLSAELRGYESGCIHPSSLDDPIRPQNTVMNSMKITKYYDMPTTKKAVIEYNERMMADGK